jgi:peptidoglycan/xylan/chitin deacetylase (PgdA/CDA1 family)
MLRRHAAHQLAWRLMAVVFTAGLLVGLLARAPETQARAAAPAARVALTFDDLPTHGPLPPGITRVDVATRIIEILRAHRTPPVYGFINAKALSDRPEDGEVLRLWRAAGFPLGNHAYSHMDLHTHTAEEFQQDVLANEPTLKSLMGGADWHWFRFPYLREGDTPEKHRAVAAFLKDSGYRVAQVTLSFDDYAYNDPYARCLARSDVQGLAWLQESYLNRASASLARGQDAARRLFGRDVGHIMLLHIGAYETVMLPKLLDLLAERGFALTTLEEAEADSAYAASAEALSRWDGTWLQQLLRARQDPLPPLPADDTFANLAALCR